MSEPQNYATPEYVHNAIAHAVMPLRSQSAANFQHAIAHTDRVIAELREELALQRAERGDDDRVNPADLPYDQLISYDQFVWALGPHPLKRRTIERYGTCPEHKGKFVPGIRMTRGKPILFKAGDVAAWIAKNTAGFEVSK